MSRTSSSTQATSISWAENEEEKLRQQWLDSITKNHTQLAEFMQKDDDHIVFRRFERLRLLNLLLLQSKLVQYDRIGRDCIQDVRNLIKSQGQFKVLPEEKLMVYLQRFKKSQSKIEHLLKRYDEALLAYQRVRQIENPRLPILDLFKTTANGGRKYTYSQALRQEYEQEGQQKDYMGLIQREKGVIHQFVDNHPYLNRLFMQSKPKDLEAAGGSEDNSWYSYPESRVRRFEQALILTIMTIIVTVPIIGLSLLNNEKVKLVVIVLCLLLAIVASPVIITKSTHANFGILASYGAVLVAFMTSNK